jgi:hypothetical protein
MADLKPIGSEKLQGQDKLARIMEIARYKEVSPSNINETAKDEFSRVLADGNEYHIVKEKVGYIIKKSVNESLDYTEPMKNRKYYSSYSQALKRLNLLAKEMNAIHENEEEVSLFGEQKKFVLKTPTPPAPEPSAEPAAELPPPAPAAEPDAAPEGGDEMNLDMPDLGGEDSVDEPMSDIDAAEPDDEEEVTMKTIQKLTGKLGQKIRVINDSVGMTSDDVKYVINSVLSALNLSLLDENDKQDIMDRLEEAPESSEEPMMGDEEPMGDEGDSMPDLADLGIDDTEAPAEPTGEMAELEEEGGPENGYKPGSNHPFTTKVSKIMDSVFAESKVDKVLKSYFTVTESEKKFKKNVEVEKHIDKKNHVKRTISSIKKLSETVEQELASEFIIKENSDYKLLGKTNKNNLIFENEGIQIKVTPKGEIL